MLILVALSWLGGLVFLYFTLVLVVAGKPRFVFLGLIPTVACFMIGRRLRVGKRKTILYLRRFHTLDTRLRGAITWFLDRRYRVLTLDDGKLKPARMPLVDVVGALITGVLWGGLVGLLAGITVFGFTDEPPELQVWNVLVTAIMILPGFAAGLLFSVIRIIAVLRRARLHVRERPDMQQLTKKLNLLRGSGITTSYLVPRLVVASVTDELWRDAVARAAAETACVLVDVSEPSENLLWEIDYLNENSDRPVIFAANRQAFQRWHDESPDTSSSDVRRLRRRLEDRDVLVYDGTGSLGTLRLGKSLTAAFDNLLWSPTQQ